RSGATEEWNNGGERLAQPLDEVFREARVLRRLSHPAIIGVRDCEYAAPAKKNRPYIVMEYFAGSTLEQFVQERGTLTVEQFLPVARQIAQGMEAAHRQGILHRDLKPGNVLVREERGQWQTRIIDFGLALQRESVRAGTTQVRANRKSMLAWSVAGTLEYAP